MRFIPLEEAEKQLQFVPLSAVKTEQSADAAPLLSPEETITSPDDLVDPEAALLSGVVTPAAPEAPAPGRVRTERDLQFAPLEEAGTGAKAAVEGLANLPAIYKLQQNADIVGFRRKELDAFNMLDAGQQITPAQASQMGVDYARILQYQNADPTRRQEFKAFNQQAVDEAKVGVQEGLKLYAQFTKDMQKYQGRTPNVTDVETATDFANWLGYNVGSGAVQLAPIILATLTTGGVGAFTVGTGMAGQETLGNRLDFILKQTQGQNPQEQADAVAKYLRETGDVSAMVSIASGALDLAGPVGTILRKQFAKELGQEVLKYGSKKEAAKAAAKQAPRELVEEGLTGGAQEATQITGERVLGEQTGDILSKENLKRVIDSAAAEAAGSLGGSAFNVAAATGKQAVDEYTEKKLAEAAEDARRQKTVEDNKAAISADFNARVAQYISEGKSEEEAVRLAGADIATGEDLGPGQPAPGVGKPSVSVPGGEGTSGEPAAGVAATGQPGVGADLDIIDVAEGGTDATQPALSPAYTAVKTLKDKADELIKRSIELTEKMRSYTSADKRGRLVTPRSGSKRWNEWQAVQEEIQRNSNEWNKVNFEFNQAKEAYLNDPANAEEIARLQAEKAAQQNVTESADAATTVAPDVNKTDQEKKETELDGPEGQVDAAFPSSTEAGQTTTAAPPTNPNTGLQAKGKKRGRPAVALTPEQEAERKKQRTQMAGESRDATRAANKALAVLEKEIDPEEYDLPESAQDAANLLEQERIEALIEAFKIAKNPKHRMNAAGKAAKAVLDHPTVTAREREIAKNRYERDLATVRSTAIQDSTNGEYNPAFANFTTATQALQYIIRTGNAFEKLLARRMLPFVRNVRLVIVNDPAVDVPANLQDAYFEARGLYDAVGKTIYLNNHTDEFGQGLNNTVVLHEALHGATMDLITFVQANQDKEGVVSEQLQNAYDMMFATMLEASDMHRKLKAAGRSRASIDKLADIGVFEDIKEFVAYGITQPELQEFLMQIPSKIPASVKAMKLFGRKNLFNKFVSSIRQMFNMGPQYDDAFTSLVIATDQMLQAPDLTTEQMADILDKLLPSAAKKVDRTTEKLERKILLSNKMSALNEGIVGLLKQTRSFKDGVEVMRAIWKTGDVRLIKTGLGFFSTEGITRMFGNQIVNLKNINNAVNVMASSRIMALREAMKLVPALHKFNKTKAAGQLLGDTMNVSTLANVDPTLHTDLTAALANDKEMKDLDAKLADPKTTAKEAVVLRGKKTRRARELAVVYKRWDALGKTKKGIGQELFVKLKDAYNAVFQRHMNILTAQVAASPVPGDAKDASTPKGKLMAAITKNFQEAKKLAVYFPLMRYGQYWFRVGKGKDSEFYMFESETARNYAVAKRVEELNTGYKPGAKKTLDQLIADGEIEVNNTLSSLRKATTDSSTMLKELFALIDTQGVTDKEALKDQIYQMYLMTLPESDVRKKFTKRAGKTGFSADYIRNYVVTMHTTANQLSRLEYSNDVRNAVGAAYAELKNNPKAVKLSAVVDEVAQRAVAEMSPNAGNDLIDALAKLGNQAVFYYMLTSIKSAIIQTTQLAIVGLPVLVSQYGPKALSTALRYTALFDKLGTFTKDPNTGEIKVTWGQPTVRDSLYVMRQKGPYQAALIRAWNKANDNDLFMSTLVSDITNRGNISTEGYLSPSRTALRTVGNVMSGSFHHLERISREIMYMSSFELEYAKAKSQGLSDAAAESRAIDKATELVHEALFDYTQYNKPRYFKKGLSRLAFQFALFPMYSASFLIRNFYSAIALTTPGQERAEAATKLLGVYLMTGIFSGVTGLPFYSLFVGLAEGARELFRPGGDDEDDPEKIARAMTYDTDPSGAVLGYRNLDLWLRGWFIPHFFGPGSDISKTLGLSDRAAHKLARSVEMGPVSALSDIDISGSTSMADIANANWMLESSAKALVYFLNPTGSAKDAATEAAFENMLGPFGSTIQQATGAYDDFRKGEIIRGMEKLAPAFFRGSLTSIRLYEEGSKTASKDQIMNPEYYTTGKLFAQVLGFGSAEVNALQKANFLAKSEIQKIEAKRTVLLNRFMTAVDKREYETVGEVASEIRAFNRKNPVEGLVIDADTIDAAIERYIRDRGQNVQGFRATEKAMGAFGPLIWGTRSPVGVPQGQ